MIIPFDPTGLDQRTAEVLEEIVGALQSGFGKQFEALGNWIDIPYLAGNYGQNLGKWSVLQGSQRVARYAIFGGTMALQLSVTDTSTDGSIDSALTFKIPGGYKFAAGDKFTCAGAVNWGVSGTGVAGAGVAKPGWDGGYSPLTDRSGLVGLFKDVIEDPWTSGLTGTLWLGGTFIFPVVKV